MIFYYSEIWALSFSQTFSFCQNLYYCIVCTVFLKFCASKRKFLPKKNKLYFIINIFLKLFQMLVYRIFLKKNVPFKMHLIGKKTTTKIYYFTFYSSKNSEYKCITRSSTIRWEEMSWAANQFIRLISEDHVTLKTTNNAENSAAHHRNKLHYKI